MLALAASAKKASIVAKLLQRSEVDVNGQGKVSGVHTIQKVKSTLILTTNDSIVRVNSFIVCY